MMNYELFFAVFDFDLNKSRCLIYTKKLTCHSSFIILKPLKVPNIKITCLLLFFPWSTKNRCLRYSSRLTCCNNFFDELY